MKWVSRADLTFLLNLLKQRAISLVSLLLLLMVGSSSLAEERISFYHNDLLGSPVAATDQNGKLLWKEDYKPFGEKTDNDPSSGLNNIAYTGKEHDDDIGLSYFGARYYDPAVGRFMGVDKAGVIGNIEKNPMMFNRYAYANNNPYVFIDPDGNEPVGFNVGGQVVLDPAKKVGIKNTASTIVAFDTKTFELAIFSQQENGVAHSSSRGDASVFWNVLYGDEGSSMSDLEGDAVSANGGVTLINGFGVNGSISDPGGDGTGPGFTEFGLSKSIIPGKSYELGVTKSRTRKVGSSMVVDNFRNKVNQKVVDYLTPKSEALKEFLFGEKEK